MTPGPTHNVRRVFVSLARPCSCVPTVRRARPSLSFVVFSQGQTASRTNNPYLKKNVIQKAVNQNQLLTVLLCWLVLLRVECAERAASHVQLMLLSCSCAAKPGSGCVFVVAGGGTVDERSVPPIEQVDFCRQGPARWICTRRSPGENSYAKLKLLGRRVCC